MEWNQIQAISSVLGVVATFSASAVALYLGQRKPKKYLSISANFYEKDRVIRGAIDPRYLILAADLDSDGGDDRLLGFNVRNACNEEIVLVGFLERAHFNRAVKTFCRRLLHLRKRALSIGTKYGYFSIDCRFGDMPYMFNSVVAIKPNEQQLFCIDYDCIKATQIDRKKSGMFCLEKPLRFFAMDVEGKRYLVTSKVPAENFYKEKTCRMIKTHWLD